MRDAAASDPDKYRVIFENDKVRVLEFHDLPGERTSPHHHPDSVMVSLSTFHRRLAVGCDTIDIALHPGDIRWLDAHDTSGENTGISPTHVIFVELKGTAGT